MPSPKDNLPVAQMQEAERCRYNISPLNQVPAYWRCRIWVCTLARRMGWCAKPSISDTNVLGFCKASAQPTG